MRSTAVSGWVPARFSLVVVGLVLVGVFAWWQFAFAPTASLAPLTNAAPTTDVAQAVDSTAKAPDGERNSIAGTEANSAGAPTRLRIDVALPNGEPAVGANVRVADIELVTDALGSASTIVADKQKVTATLGNLYGEGEWPEEWSDGTARVWIALAPDVNLVVEVVDTAGAPQDRVSIGVCAIVATRRTGVTEQTWFIETDARGRAELQHVQCTAGYSDGLAATVHFTCHGSDSTPNGPPIVERSLNWNQLLAEPKVTLIVPPNGTIMVQVLSANGTAFHFDTTIENQLDEMLRSDSEGDFEVFRMVPLGRTWSLWIDGVTESKRIRGPERPGEVVRIDIPWDHHSWRFRGCIVRADGKPFPEGTLATITLRDPQYAKAPFISAHLALTEPFDLGTCIGSTDLHKLEVSIEPNEDLFAPVTVHFEQSLHAGEVDLGQIALRPIADLLTLASVEVVSGASTRTHETTFKLLDGEQAVALLVERCGDSQLLIGRKPRQPLRLESRCFGCLPIPSTQVRLGEHHRIEALPAAMLRIELAGLTVPIDAIVGELVPRHGSNRTPLIGNTLSNALAWLNCEPGSYSLRIRCGDQVVLEEQDLILAPGTQRWPAGGRPIDMRAARSFCVLARGACPSGEILLVEVAQTESGATSAGEVEWRTGWFLPRVSTTDVLVRCSGFVPVRLVQPTANVDLTMQPLTQLRLRARNGEDFEVQVRVVADGVTDSLLRAVDRDHEHRTRFPSSSGAWHDFAPGTELEITRVTGAEPAPVHRVKVGSTSPQVVELH